jgi:hypothetical protein
MMKKNLQTLMIILACTFVAIAPLCAVEMDMKKNNHVPIRTQKLSLDEENQEREEKALEDQKNQENRDQIPLEEHPLCVECEGREINQNSEDEVVNNEEQQADKEKVSNAARYYNSHNDAFHHVISLSGDGSTIETEDQAIYNVKWSDRYKTVYWQPYHNLLIVPNTSWFSSYNFKFVNLETGEEAHVNMSLGPVYENSKTHWIEYIDYQNRTIRLEDNSLWSMSWFDQAVVDSFVPYDVVVIGTNNGWWRASNPNILIAVKSFKYARGSRVN